jgi:hypothetical protein
MGILPINKLLKRYNESIFTHDCKVDGIEPVNQFPFKER